MLSKAPAVVAALVLIAILGALLYWIYHYFEGQNRSEDLYDDQETDESDFP